MENTVGAMTYFRRVDFEQWGLSAAGPGSRYVRTGQGRQKAHSEACRRRIDALSRGDSSGSARLAAADERINRALTDAVERHATKDPVTRGILKKAGVVCHPESEHQQKCALDPEQDFATTHSSLLRRSSGSGADPATPQAMTPIPAQATLRERGEGRTPHRR